MTELEEACYWFDKSDMSDYTRSIAHDCCLGDEAILHSGELPFVYKGDTDNANDDTKVVIQ